MSFPAVYAIIPAAGIGVRFGGPVSKQFCEIKKKPVLVYTLEAFERSPEVCGVVVVVSPGSESSTEELLRKWKLKKIIAVVKGGEKRQESVQRGLEALAQMKLSPSDLVVVHDGVRPLVSVSLISRTIEAAGVSGAAVAALPLKETIKRGKGRKVLETVDREGLWGVQTPQVFRVGLLKRAFEKAVRENFYGTDEAMLVEHLGEEVTLVEGEPWNIKITTPKDLEQAEIYLEQRR